MYLLISFYQLIFSTKKCDFHRTFFNKNGGVREDRTLAPVARSTSLAGKPLHHLGITPLSIQA